jgi:hypothetical protein
MQMVVSSAVGVAVSDFLSELPKEPPTVKMWDVMSVPVLGLPMVLTKEPPTVKMWDVMSVPV